MKLWEKINVGGMELKNRLMFPPMVSKRADMLSGRVTENMKNLYVNIAKGGPGIVVIELTFTSAPQMTLLSLHEDGNIAGFKDMIDAVHAESDAKIVVQLGDFIPGMLDVEEMPVEFIYMFIDNFKNACARAIAAGIDGIEVHGAHSYMCASLLSFRNKRKDEWGKDLEGRMRLINTCIAIAKEEGGKNFPVGVRINADEFIVGGNTLLHTTQIAPILCEQGIAYLSLSVGGKNQDAWTITDTLLQFPYAKPGPWTGNEGYSGQRCLPGGYMPDGTNVYLAEAIKKAVNKAGHTVPVITAGKIPNADFAESILQEGKADMIAVCRPMLCDHEWGNKYQQGRGDEVRKCVFCNNCMDIARKGFPTTCIKWPDEMKFPLFKQVMKRY